MRTYFFLDENNNQFGPFEKDQLHGKITEESFVWREGLTDWTKANELPDFIDFFSKKYDIGERADVTQQPFFTGNNPYTNNNIGDNEIPTQQPNTYKSWSILSIIIFSTALGIVALIMGNISNEKWHAKNYQAAEKFSKLAKKLNIIAMIVGIPATLLYIYYYLYTF